MLNKSFARRIGKKLSIRKKYLLEVELPKYQLDTENPNLFLKTYKETFLEIGFGMGDHFIANFLNDSKNLYIGAEPYLNGVGDVLDIIVKNDIKNVRLIADSVDILLPKLDLEIISGIYLLFPDPWSKRKQNKNRIITESRSQFFYKILKQNGSLIFASDIIDYIKDAKIILQKVGFILSDISTPHSNYVITKYHNKAIKEEREVQFLHFMKK